MQFTKPNFKYAAPIAGSDDLTRLAKEGVETLGKLANGGDIKAKACLQRLVNSGYIAEGKY